jgi:hypothetical protein
LGNGRDGGDYQHRQQSRQQHQLLQLLLLSCGLPPLTFVNVGEVYLKKKKETTIYWCPFIQWCQLLPTMTLLCTKT